MRRFAHIQDMDTGSTTLVFSLFTGIRLQSEAAMGLAISRLIEERVGLAEGMADVRKWLLIVSKLPAIACSGGDLQLMVACCHHCPALA